MRTMPRLVKDAKSAIWFFRWSLPKQLQEPLGRKTLYLSLKTREARLAKCLAAVLNLRVETMKKLPNLNEDKLRKLLEIDLDRGIFRADTPEELEKGLHIVETIGRIRQHSPSSAPAPAPAPIPKPYMQPTSPRLRAVADELLKELSLTLKSASIYKYKNTFDAYIEAKGNIFLEDIDRQDIKRFKQDMIDEGKVPHTVNGHIGRLQALFEFALKNKYIQGDNPADGLHIPHSKKVITARDKFYDADLQAIYNWDNYQTLAITPDYFWGPLVCLFSGMRIEECTSLEVSNIKTDDGVLIMHIKDAKTPNGVRFVPIHPALLKLGFMDYVQEVKNLGKERLFWYLSEGATGKLVNHNGTKKNLSRRFSSYLKKIGIKEDDNCFHSLRHTTITRLVARNVNNSTIYKLCGHKSDNSTHYDYLHELPTTTLKVAVDTIDFEQLIDLSKFEWRTALDLLLAREAKREVRAKRLEAQRQRAKVVKAPKKQ